MILGGPFLRETWLNGLQGRLTSSALIVVGVGAAYLYSAFAVIEREPHVYFDTATMVLMLFTLGRLLEAAGRARAARDLEPLLAAERESCRRGARWGGASPPGARGRSRHAGAGAAGRAHSDRRRRHRGRISHRRGGDHGRKPPGYNRRRFCGDCRQHQSRRPAPDPKQRCGNRDALGADLSIGSGGAIPAQPEPPHCRPRGWCLGAPRSGSSAR